MSANSKIEWTDHTFNPWRGCTKVSPGCEHCYAETLSKRNPKLLGEWGKGKPRRFAGEKMWKQPVKWNAAALAWQHSLDDRRAVSDPYNEEPHLWIARRPRVFTASLADWLDDEVPIEWLARLLALIHATPNLDWLLLTKRPQNWRARIMAVVEWLEGPECAIADWASEDANEEICEVWAMINDWSRQVPPPNVWIGTTVEDQARADERIPLLLTIPAKVRFLSCEPLLGPVDITRIRKGGDCWRPLDRIGTFGRIDWVICGGESGPGARPMHPDWARGLRDQCAAAGVPFFFKQWGEWMPIIPLDVSIAEISDFGGEVNPKHARILQPDGETLADEDYQKSARGSWMIERVGKAAAGRLLDGCEHSAFPV